MKRTLGEFMREQKRLEADLASADKAMISKKEELEKAQIEGMKKWHTSTKEENIKRAKEISAKLEEYEEVQLNHNNMHQELMKLIKSVFIEQ
jgi:hypothetical protein